MLLLLNEAKSAAAQAEIRPLSLKNNSEIPSANLWYTDITLRPQSQNNGSIAVQQANTPISLNSQEQHAYLDFLKDSIQEVQETQKSLTIRFLFPTENGYIVRCDFLNRRLQCCEFIKKTQSFTTPLQQIYATVSHHISSESLISTLTGAIGGIWVNTSIDPTSSSDVLEKLDHELANRLSFSWTLPDPIARKRIAWVQGRENVQSIRRAYESALALGVTLVIFDAPGHWLEDDLGPYAHYREAFVQCSAEVDDGFVQRVVDGVRSYPHKIDGVLSISDLRLAPIAKACEILGLPTSPSIAYDIAGDKAKTRLLETCDDEIAILSNSDELQDYLSSRNGKPLLFPIIVKPTLGWNSDCVSKVQNLTELEVAIHKASSRHADAAKSSTGVILEPYIDGPEVDANFAILDGEVLFYDINDDFPSKGDNEDADVDSNFQETQNVFPTALPENEVFALRNSLKKSILRQGFTSGIFHCEARVRYSRAEYVKGEDGLVDLQKKLVIPSRDVEVYLLENNPRTPGYLETVAVDLTYGVDYYALRLLLALAPIENPRIRALSKPYLNGAQFHLSAMIVPQTKSGIMKTADAGADFLKSHPELANQIPDYKTEILGGDVVGGPTASSLWWLAYFSVFSRKSRRDCLNLVQYIEDNYEYELE